MNAGAPEADWRWVAAFLRPHRTAVAALMLLSLSVSLLVMLQPWLSKLLIDDGLLARDRGALLRYALLMFGAGLAGSLLGGINRYHYTRVSARILFAIRERVFAHLQRLSPAFFQRMRSGDLLSRLDGDVAELQRFALDSVFAAASGVFGLIGTLGFMLYLSPRLTFLALLLIPVQWFYLRFMRKRVQGRVRAVRERSADIQSFLIEKLPAIKYIQSVAAETRESLRLGDLNQRFLGALLGQQLTEFATAAVPANLTAALRALVFVSGGYEVIEGRMPLGSLIAFSAYLGMATGPLQSLLGVYMAFNRVRVSMDRVGTLLDAPIEIGAGGSRLPGPGSPEIRFERISYTHPNSPGPVLRDVDLLLPAGRKLGLSGPSGGGKSTLLDLLLRHQDPESGRVLLDGIDLRDYELAAWRRRVAFVSQDIVLFRGSLRENLLYANPEAGEMRLAEAVHLAGLQAFVTALPQGLDTLIGERATRLSGGEKQRVAIARALLQHPLLIVLDEATSAVDPLTERRLMSEIDRLFPDTTRIVVSHHERTLAGVDMLVKLEGGELRVAIA